MYPQSSVLRFGAAPGALSNATLADARKMLAHWAGLSVIEGIVINTTMPGDGPFAAPMIRLDEVDPPLADDATLFFHVRVHGRMREGATVMAAEFAVAQWWRIVADPNMGLQKATIMYLASIDPKWAEDPDMATRVAALPGPPPPSVVAEPVVLVPQAPALPDWDTPVGSDPLWFAIRRGDLSPAGTTYTHPVKEMGRWVKRIESSPFGGSSHARWERA